MGEPGAAWRAEVAEQWAARLMDTAYLPMSRETVQRRLLDLVDLIADADAVDDVGWKVGASLVELHAVGEGCLTRSLELLREKMLGLGGDRATERAFAMLTAVAAGHAAAERESTFEQQETLKKALLRAKLRAEREREVTEAHFHEVFTTTPVGVAICDLTGRFLEVNPALEETLGYRSRELAEMTIHELFHPDEAKYLTAAYAELAEGEGPRRLRERRRLLNSDGGVVETYLAISVLADADGMPRQFVTMVEDVSELHRLQERFQHQALHDLLTGLPNRQFFRTRLETALATRPREATLTLYQLGLSGFDLINDGLGYEVGDAIIKHVARRLEALVADEVAMVARFGGTEFAILLLESASTPGVAEFAERINEELSEPVYLGEHGVATSANIGVVRRVVAEGEPAAMMWAADVALRRAESAGPRQWALFDPDRAPHERIEAKLAAIIPGALELGEFQPGYRPVRTLDTNQLVGLDVRLSWQPEGHDVLDHQQCLHLAEGSGVTLCLRDWLLRSTWQQVGEWHAAGYPVRLALDLSASQAQDPDLVSAVRAVVHDGDLDPSWLWLSVPIAALLGDREEARENVGYLGELGVSTALHDFHGSPTEVRSLRDLRVSAVRLSPELIDIAHAHEDSETPEVRAVRGLVPLLGGTGRWIVVDGIDSPHQAELWRALGCHAAVGPFCGQPLPHTDVPPLLAEASLVG